MMRILVDVFLMVVPCLFIALAIVAAYLNGRAPSSYGQKVEEAAKLGPTIFPIAFAAIVGRFNRHLATWQAERGERLGVLEQLMQSQSLSGSVVAVYNLRYFSLTSFAIFLLWAFSPIGGQSSLRVLSITNVNNQTQSPVYGITAAPMTYFGGLAHETNDQGAVNALFSACLLAPDDIKNGPTDTWGNVKIPAAEYVSDLDSGAWYTVDANTNYSSLIGVPTFAIPKQGTANFSIFWPIFNTECVWDFPGYTALEWCYFVLNQTDQANQTCVYNETTGQLQGRDYSTLVGFLTTDVLNGFDSDPHWNVSSTQLYNNSPPRYLNITFSAPWSSQVNNITYYGLKQQCKLVTTRVEAEIFCADGSCAVSRVRRANESLPDFINPWNDATFLPDEAFLKLQYFSIMLQFLPQTTGITTSYYITPFEAFLGGWLYPYNQSTIPSLNWTDVSNAEFSTQLSTVLNTFWTISQWTAQITDHSATNLSYAGIVNASTGAVTEFFQQATATMINQYPVYKANYAWIIVLLVVSAILLICTVGSLILRLFTIAPDILCYVSSFTRDSPYFEPLGPGGSLLTGTERARRLRNVRVQIADTRPESEVGHVAFVRTGTLADANGDGKDFARLRKDRLYD